MTRRVIREASPRFLVLDDRCFEPECGHHSTAESAYDELATALVLAREERYPSDTAAQNERYIRVVARLTRWLTWADRVEHGE